MAGLAQLLLPEAGREPLTETENRNRQSQGRSIVMMSTSFVSWTKSTPKCRGLYSERKPFPCSPQMTPPYFVQSAATLSEMRRTRARDEVGQDLHESRRVVVEGKMAGAGEDLQLAVRHQLMRAPPMVAHSSASRVRVA